MSRIPQHIAETGMMGSGKTTIGRELARKMGKSFVDTDEWITQETGRTCKEIVDDPECDFTSIQRAVIIKRMSGLVIPHVIATGGSVPMDAVTFQPILDTSIIIFLDPTEAALRARLTEERISALNNPDNLSFGDLLKQRRPLYEQHADARIMVPEHETPETTTIRVLQAIARVRSHE